MANESDLLRAVDAMLEYRKSQDITPLDEIEYWRAKYWQMQDDYDMIVDRLETIVREAK